MNIFLFKFRHDRKNHFRLGLTLHCFVTLKRNNPGVCWFSFLHILFAIYILVLFASLGHYLIFVKTMLSRFGVFFFSISDFSKLFLLSFSTVYKKVNVWLLPSVRFKYKPGYKSSNLINKRHSSQILQKTIWLWNHTFHKKNFFNEFVANVLCDNMSMIICDLWGCGGW